MNVSDRFQASCGIRCQDKLADTKFSLSKSPQTQSGFPVKIQVSKAHTKL